MSGIGHALVYESPSTGTSNVSAPRPTESNVRADVQKLAVAKTEPDKENAVKNAFMDSIGQLPQKGLQDYANATTLAGEGKLSPAAFKQVDNLLDQDQKQAGRAPLGEVTTAVLNLGIEASMPQAATAATPGKESPSAAVIAPASAVLSAPQNSAPATEGYMPTAGAGAHTGAQQQGLIGGNASGQTMSVAA